MILKLPSQENPQRTKKFKKRKTQNQIFFPKLAKKCDFEPFLV